MVDYEFISRMEKDLTSMLLTANQSLLESCAPCLVALHKYSETTEKLKIISLNCIAKIKTFMTPQLFNESDNTRYRVVFRLLLVLSLLQRYYDDQSTASEVYQIIMYFCQNMPKNSLYLIPVIAMGNLFRGNPSRMLNEDSLKFIADVFANECLNCKREVIKVLLFAIDSNAGTEIPKPGKIVGINELLGAENDCGVSTGILIFYVSDNSKFP